ncbi:MAG: hypothetical protein PHF31_08470 [Methylobacter sp.]|nr:hypothetical protein [Methylobacter sp.]
MRQIEKIGKKAIAEIVQYPKTIKLLREIAVNYEQSYIFGKTSGQFLERNVFQINDALQRADIPIDWT